VSFNTQLIHLRKTARITQGELAQAIGAAQSTVSQLEAGTRKPSYNMLRAIAGALNVSISYLLSEDAEVAPTDEEQHFREYRSLTPEAREELHAYTSFLQQKHRSATRKES
jgi:transcriptional regulator with XRE-family HTH domain